MSSVYSPYGGMQFLPCQRCQAALPPNEALCRNCGYNNATGQGSNAAVVSQQAPPAMGGWGADSSQPQYGQGQEQYGGQSWGQPAQSPTAPPPQVANGPRPSSSGLLRSSGGNFFGAPNPTSQDNVGQGMSSMPPSFAARPPTGTLSTGTASQAPYYGMPLAGPAPFGGQGQYPAGFAAPDTSPPQGLGPQYSMPGMPPAGFGAPDTSPPQGLGPQYLMPGMPPAGFGAPNTSPAQPLGPQYSMPGMPPAGFAGPNTSPAQPSGTQYGMMPGMAPNPNASPNGWPGQQPSGFAGPGMSPAQPSGTQYGMVPGMASNASSFAQQAGRDMQAPAFNEGAAGRRKPKPWLIALIIVLVVVLAGGGFAGYTVLKAQKSTSTKVTSVATIAPQGTPLFADTFKDNANKWNLQSYPNEFAVSIANNSLVLEDDQHELLWELVPGAKPYGDFTLSVDSMLSQGQQNNGYGIYIRGSSIQNSELGTYYRFEIYGDGSYAIFKGALNTTSVKLVDYTLNSAIQKEGSVNHIAITAKGSSMSLTINGQVIKTISDSSYVSGSIAFFVSNLQNATAGAKAQFSHLAIYPA